MEYILFTTKKSIDLSYDPCWQDQLHGVVEVVAGGSAFAALRGDGEVITWGHCRWGGDSNQVADELRPAKVAVEKIWGGWCVMVLWRFGWLVGLWDAFMACYLWEKNSQNHVCLMWKTQMANARHLYDHAFHFQLFSTWFPSCTPRYFGNESLPLCLGWGHSYVRGRHLPPQEAKPGFYKKCIFGYVLNKDAWQIIVAGKEIFNDVLGHVWNKEAWGVWHISFLQWNIVKAFFSERKRNESFQTKRKSIRFLAVFHDSH